jgi:hypothetical protein
MNFKRVIYLALPFAVLAPLAFVARRQPPSPVPYRIGAVVADFSARNVDGRTVRLSDYDGKIIVINFFSQA